MKCMTLYVSRIYMISFFLEVFTYMNRLEFVIVLCLEKVVGLPREHVESSVKRVVKLVFRIKKNNKLSSYFNQTV